MMDVNTFSNIVGPYIPACLKLQQKLLDLLMPAKPFGLCQLNHSWHHPLWSLLFVPPRHVHHHKGNLLHTL
jgi:hypothetical protein